MQPSNGGSLHLCLPLHVYKSIVSVVHHQLYAMALGKSLGIFRLPGDAEPTCTPVPGNAEWSGEGSGLAETWSLRWTNGVRSSQETTMAQGHTCFEGYTPWN